MEETKYEKNFCIITGAFDAALADKTAWACGAILSLGKSVDTVVEQNHIEVDVASVGMYEVVHLVDERALVEADALGAVVYVGVS